jgi:hypothetical protein
MSDIVKRLRSTDFASATDGLRSPVIWVKGEVAREAADEIEKLRAALHLAIDAVEHWASYASPYYQEKHDLAEDLQKLRAALGEKE